MSAGAFKLSHSDGPVAPPLPSLVSFMEVLVATILPALMGRPTAQAEWLSLSRSVIAVNCRSGWEAARRYLDLVVYDRVRQRTGFAAINQSALDGIRTSSFSSHAPFEHQHESRDRGPSNAGGTRPPAADNACRDFNRMEGCRHGPRCRYKHICTNPQCHNKSHPLHQCPLRSSSARPTPSPPRREFDRDDRNRGSGSGRNVRKGSSSETPPSGAKAEPAEE